jgi:hypothetical protein
MNLNLKIREPYPPSRVTATFVRELVEEDRALLAGREVAPPSPLKTLRSRHHALAGYLATGLSDQAVAVLTGFPVGAISFLKSDPAFRDLVEFYTRDYTNLVVDKQIEMNERMLGLGLDATTILTERIETDPDSFSVNELQSIVKLTADRTGNGPTSTSLEVKVHVDLAARLQAAREKAAAAIKSIEGTITSV